MINNNRVKYLLESLGNHLISVITNSWRRVMQVKVLIIRKRQQQKTQLWINVLKKKTISPYNYSSLISKTLRILTSMPSMINIWRLIKTRCMYLFKQKTITTSINILNLFSIKVSVTKCYSLQKWIHWICIQNKD
jgi:hypothetical protein